MIRAPGAMSADEAEIEKVAGHLVDDARRAGVERMKLGQIAGRRRGQDFRRRARQRAAQTPGRPREPPSAAKAWPSAVRSPAPKTSRWAPRICSTSVVPERGMPTTKTGAGSRFAARGPCFSRAALNASIDASTKARCAVARERLEPRDELVPCGPLGEGADWRVLRRPEFGEIEPRHDRVLGNGVGAHVREGELHSLRLLAGARAVAFGERQQDEAPVQERRQRGRGRPRAHEFVENVSRASAARPSCSRARASWRRQWRKASEIVRRLCAVEKLQRFRGTLLLQEVGGQVEARADGVGRAHDRLLQ